MQTYRIFDVLLNLGMIVTLMLYACYITGVTLVF